MKTAFDSSNKKKSDLTWYEYNEKTRELSKVMK